jgi:hypothetical protein
MDYGAVREEVEERGQAKRGRRHEKGEEKGENEGNEVEEKRGITKGRRHEKGKRREG